MLDMLISLNILVIASFDVIDLSDKLQDLLLTDITSSSARVHVLDLPQFHPLSLLCSPRTPLTYLLLFQYAPSNHLWLSGVPFS